MPTTMVPSNHSSEDPKAEISVVSDPADEIPSWLAARRGKESSPSTPIDHQPAIASSHPPRTVKRASTGMGEVLAKVEPTNELLSPATWQERWFPRQGMIGIAVSLVVHAVVLLILACFIVSQVKNSEMTSIWGNIGDGDELAADIILDSQIAGDEGESSPLETTEASQNLDALGVNGDLSESMRVGLGGNGQGDGASGDGTSVGVGALKIPGHAQTKGSFSTWADPRDPKPGEDYDIVIQVKLPPNVTKYRGSDISGNVIGTDSYRQAIRLKASELLPVVDGVVQIRIHVPGGGRLVRDTIRVESKILREKQTFEIEF